MDDRERAAREICAVLRRAGHRALLAGGCVRDWLLGLTPKDYDIATSAPVSQVRDLFERTIDVGAAFGVLVVVTPEGTFEVATFRRDGPYLDGRHPSHVEFLDEREDALRRDFTVNALFLDPVDNTVLDYVGGRQDLEARVIRAVGDPRKRFAEDYLRMLRAVRFAARLDYRIDPATRKALCDMAPHILRTSAERIRDELVMILTEGGARRAFSLLDKTGLLEHILPEVSAMKGVAQPKPFHPEGDVFTHTLLMLEQMDRASRTLAMGVLLHDVGKPPTQTFEDRIRFNNHHKLGARMSRRICRGLRFSNDDIDRIAWLVEQHMRLMTLPDMRESKRIRFVREAGFGELLELGRLDCLASHGDLSTIAWICDYLAQLPPEAVRPKLWLSGHDLIAMSYPEGPLIGKILTALEDAQLEGKLPDVESARAFVRARWNPKTD